MQYRGELGDCAQILQSSVHVLLNCTCTDDHRLLVFTVRLLLLRNNKVKNNRNYFITAVFRRKLRRHINRCTMDASLTSPSAALTPPSQGGMGMAYNTPASASTSHLRANQLCFRTHSTSAPNFCTHSTSAPTSLIFFNSGGGQTFSLSTSQFDRILMFLHRWESHIYGSLLFSTSPFLSTIDVAYTK
jgi:hypothetical protein